MPKVGVKVKGQGKGQRSRSNFRRAAVNIRGSALPSAVKGNKSHCQSKLFVCNHWPYANNCTDVVDRLLIIDCVA